MGIVMPRGSKGSYSKKQKRKAKHIAKGYEKRGTSHEEAESRAWATVNKESGGGKKKRLWPWEEAQQVLLEKGRSKRKSKSIARLACSCRQEGCAHSKAQRTLETHSRS